MIKLLVLIAQKSFTISCIGAKLILTSKIGDNIPFLTSNLKYICPLLTHHCLWTLIKYCYPSTRTYINDFVYLFFR